MGDCLKELDETAYWLEVFVESGAIPGEALSALRDEANQLTAIFATIIKRSKETSEQ